MTYQQALEYLADALPVPVTLVAPEAIHELDAIELARVIESLQDRIDELEEDQE